MVKRAGYDFAHVQVDDPTASDFYGNRYVFGFIRTRTFSLSTRLSWTFTPNLTLQLFAQPFVFAPATILWAPWNTTEPATRSSVGRRRLLAASYRA